MTSSKLLENQASVKEILALGNQKTYTGSEPFGAYPREQVKQ